MPILVCTPSLPTYLSFFINLPNYLYIYLGVQLPILVCTPKLPTYLYFSIILIVYLLSSFIIYYRGLTWVPILSPMCPCKCDSSATTQGYGRFLFCHLHTLMYSFISLGCLFSIINSWSLILYLKKIMGLFMCYSALEEYVVWVFKCVMCLCYGIYSEVPPPPKIHSA